MSSKQAIRLADLHVGMFVEVNSGDPKNPWWGEIHQIHSKKKTVVKKSKEEEDEDFEPIGVKWIARVLGTKEKLYEYKGGSHRIWKESIVKCGHDLDCGLYLKGKGRKVLSKAPNNSKSFENKNNNKNTNKNTKNSNMALVVRKSTPTKKKTDKGRAVHLVKEKRQTELNKRLARESERLKKEKARWVKAAREANLKAREANRKVASIEKDQVRVASGKMPSGKKMPSTPIKQRTKSAPVSKKSPGGAVFQRVLTKGLGVAKKMMVPSSKKQAYHKQMAKLTQPLPQKKLKTSKRVKRATSLPQPTTYKTARKSAPGVVFGTLSATDSDDDSDEF